MAHIKESHKFKCNRCETFAETLDDLKKHVDSSHSQQHVKFHICPICKAVFNNASLLENHIKETHSETTQSENFECNICEIHLQSQAQVKEHMITEHYSECSTCGKKFQTTTQLREHTLSCIIQPCDSCSDIFYTTSDLNSHIKKIMQSNVHRVICLFRLKAI